MSFPVNLCTWVSCRRPWWAELSPCAEIPPRWPRSHLRWCLLHTHKNNTCMLTRSHQDALQSAMASINWSLFDSKIETHVRYKCGEPCMCSRGIWLIADLHVRRKCFISTCQSHKCIFIYKSHTVPFLIRCGVTSHAWQRPLWGFTNKAYFPFSKTTAWPASCDEVIVYKARQREQ